MTLKEEKHLVIRLTEFGLKNQSFTKQEIWAGLQIDNDENKELRNYISNTLIGVNQHGTNNPNHVFQNFSVNNENSNLSRYSLCPNAFYNYVDHLEVKQARRSSIIALIISLIALTVSTISGYYQVKQYQDGKEIHIDNDDG